VALSPHPEPTEDAYKPPTNRPVTYQVKQTGGVASTVSLKITDWATNAAKDESDTVEFKNSNGSDFPVTIVIGDGPFTDNSPITDLAVGASVSRTIINGASGTYKYSVAATFGTVGESFSYDPRFIIST